MNATINMTPSSKTIDHDVREQIRERLSKTQTRISTAPSFSMARTAPSSTLGSRKSSARPQSSK